MNPINEKPSKEYLLQVLHQHYRDTCESIGKVDRQRDRYTLYTTIALAVLLLGAFGSVGIEEVVKLLLKKWLGQEVLVSTEYLRCIFWFALFVLTLKYFSAVVQRERLLKYTHGLEERLNTLGEDGLVTREGKSYLRNYPLFQDWVRVVYTWILPLALLLVVAVCLIAEVRTKKVGCSVVVVDIMISVCVVISTVLYLLFLHKNDKKKQTT